MTSGFLHPGDPVLFMKVGTHAREDLSKIIERKQQEIAAAGYAMWGYGGSTCYPNMVRPFAEASAASGRVVRLCMEEMNSKHSAEQIRAAQYSVDDSTWHDIPRAINVMGSRFALCINQLEQLDFEEELPLDATEVAIGRSKGRIGSDYIRGRVDKACLKVIGEASDPEKIKKISLVADVIEPYAVFLR
jgi:hypothetical protein